MWSASLSVTASADRSLCVSVAHGKILAVAASRRNGTVKMTVHHLLVWACCQVPQEPFCWVWTSLDCTSRFSSGNTAMQIYGTLQWAWMTGITNTSLCDLTWYLLEDFGVYLPVLYLLLVSEQHGERVVGKGGAARPGGTHSCNRGQPSPVTRWRTSHSGRYCTSSATRTFRLKHGASAGFLFPPPGFWRHLHRAPDLKPGDEWHGVTHAQNQKHLTLENWLQF